MGDVLEFKRPSITQKRKAVAQKHKGKSLCKSGFHKWKVVTEKQFDVKQGRLVTRSCCQRCGKEKVEAL